MRAFLIYMSGTTGRIIRIVVGAALAVTGIVLGGGWSALTVFSAAPIATGVFDVCPIGPLAKLPFTGPAIRAAGLTCPTDPA